MLKTLIEYIVKSFVEKPDQVHVVESLDDQRRKYLIFVDDQDIGKMIGKEGRTIRAVRAVAVAFGPKDKEIIIEVDK